MAAREVPLRCQPTLPEPWGVVGDDGGPTWVAQTHGWPTSAGNSLGSPRTALSSDPSAHADERMGAPKG